MFERILKLYTMAMALDVRSPLPHIVGPPGCGKSTVVAQLAELLGVNLHIINLSRVSPLELEGVQMPVGMETSDPRLRLLHATFWTQIQKGDIVLFDEALRAFAETFNGLLDILTSREVGGYKIPPAFFIAASNSVTTYDSALEDRLLHLPVPDPRNDKRVRRDIQALVVDALGLSPEMVNHHAMISLIDMEVLPMYEILDRFKGQGGSGVTRSIKGTSVRKLIGQAQLREIESGYLRQVLDENNTLAMRDGKPQYVFIYDGKVVPPGYVNDAKSLGAKHLRSRLTETQALNLDLNLELIELETIRNKKEVPADDDDSAVFDF